MVRAAALLALLAALIGWYELAPHVGGSSLWPSIWLIALVLMPLNFLLVWLALPLWDNRLLLPFGLGLAVLAVGFSKLDVPVVSNFCKLFAVTFVGFSAWVTAAPVPKEKPREGLIGVVKDGEVLLLKPDGTVAHRLKPKTPWAETAIAHPAPTATGVQLS